MRRVGWDWMRLLPIYSSFSKLKGLVRSKTSDAYILCQVDYGVCLIFVKFSSRYSGTALAEHSQSRVHHGYRASSPVDRERNRSSGYLCDTPRSAMKTPKQILKKTLARPHGLSNYLSVEKSCRVSYSTIMFWRSVIFF